MKKYFSKNSYLFSSHFIGKAYLMLLFLLNILDKCYSLNCPIMTFFDYSKNNCVCPKNFLFQISDNSNECLGNYFHIKIISLFI